jgi:chromosomal replication initiation ATPase DnaA
MAEIDAAGRSLLADGRLLEAMGAARALRFSEHVEELAAEAGVSLEVLRGPCRRRGLVELRRIVARYLRSRGCSLPEIGAALGRDHTTVLHLLRTQPRRSSL